MKYKFYIKKLFLIIFICSTIIFSGNYIIDPYGINNIVKEKGFNYFKPGYHLNTREWKIYNSLDINPNTIFLGSSTMEYLKPEDYFINQKETVPFNFANSNGTAYETYYYLKFAMDNFDIKKVIYGIDFFSLMDTGKLFYGSFDKNLLSKNYYQLKSKYYQNFFTMNAISKSFLTINSNINDKNGYNINRHYNKYGSRTNTWREYKLEKNGNNWISNEINSTYSAEYKLYSKIINLSKDLKESYLNTIKKLNNNKVKHHIFIPPYHYKFYNKIINSKIYRLYVNYLVFLAQNGGFYYFQGDNKFTRNQNLFWDSYHSRRQMSDIIFHHIDNNICRDDFFGCYIDEKNIDNLLKYIKKDKVK